MESTSKHFVLVAGEASGDMHAADLVEELKQRLPSATFSGLGGQKMKASGVELYQDMTEFAIVGFWEVVKHYRDIKNIFNLVLQKIKTIQPAAVILVDYPGFNLRLAKELKKQNIKVIYYISPQVWAWKKNRVHCIKRDVDQMLVLFKFEKDFYARMGIDVEFVGHPLIDTVQVKITKESFLKLTRLSNDRLTIGILPGSRHKEIETLLPIMVESGNQLAKEFPSIQFLIIKAPTVEVTTIKRHLQDSLFDYHIVEENPYDGINACDLCIVASGTATLETAILQKPMVVVYKTSLLTWVLAKFFVKIKNIGLVNVVAGKRIVPECVQFQATGKRIADELKSIFTDEITIAEIKKNLKDIKFALGSEGASQRAAAKILDVINA